MFRTWNVLSEPVSVDILRPRVLAPTSRRQIRESCCDNLGPLGELITLFLFRTGLFIATQNCSLIVLKGYNAIIDNIWWMALCYTSSGTRRGFQTFYFHLFVDKLDFSGQSLLSQSCNLATPRIPFHSVEWLYVYNQCTTLYTYTI